MNLLYDAGCLINLAAGQVLDLLVSTSDYLGYIGPLVEGESVSVMSALAKLIDSGRLIRLPDLEMNVSDFEVLMQSHDLGVGETECLAFALSNDFVVSCDDAKARKVLISQLSAKRVTGTLGLLIRAVQAGQLSQTEAFGSFLQMKKMGGFLPNLTQEAFSALI